MDAGTLTARLPKPEELERRCVALATLDAILSPDWEYRYYSFHRRWNPESGARMASMRNGSGDEYFILFFADGSAAMKGFAHESSALHGKTIVEGVLDGLPDRFAELANEPAFNADGTTFCLWNEGGGWRRSRSLSRATVDADGSGEMLALLAGTPADYAAFARDYFEIVVPKEVVARFFCLEPLTQELASGLVADTTLDGLHDDLDEIGYPIAS